jgi:cytochrome oxidase assembly protein ShyY1
VSENIIAATLMAIKPMALGDWQLQRRASDRL